MFLRGHGGRTAVVVERERSNMHVIRATICLITATLALACSNHWREVNHGLTPADMQNILEEVDQASAQSQGVGDLTEAMSLREDPNVTIFFADAPSPIGQIPNILGFFNYEFLGLPDIGYKDVSAARVLFFDAPQPDGSRKAALIIGIKQASQDQFSYYAYNGFGSLTDTDYEADLQTGSGASNIVVKTFDASGAGLDDVIQLKLYDSFNGAYLGKIATLVGFKN